MNSGSKKIFRIGIDGRLWNESGVGRYIRNLIFGIDSVEFKNPSSNRYIIFLKKNDFNNIVFKSKNFEKKLADISWHSISEQIILPRILKKENLDIVHFPYFSVPVFYNRPYVLTLHDLIINSFSTGKASTLPYPVFMLKKLGYNFVVKKAISDAASIIVPTRTVKENIEERYSGLKTKINVIYEGGFKEDSEKFKNPLEGKKYFLRVGNAYPHKNVEKLLEAFMLFKESYKKEDMYLVLAGKQDFFYNKIKIKVEELGLTNAVIFYDSPSDAVLKSLYKNAAALIIPSLMEGFSLTAIEAMSLGCIVLASDIPVHREVCSDAAIYCNPYDAHDIKHQLIKIASFNAAARAEILKRGLLRAKDFSWQKMVSETLRIYESCISV